MHHYRNILFDLDGTVIDSKHGVLACVRKTFAELGLTLPDESQLDGFMGPPIDECFTQVCGISKEQTAAAIKVYRRYYEGGGIYDVKLYYGIEKLLCDLKAGGCRLGIATSKNQRMAGIVLRHCGIFEYFDTIAGEPDNISEKWFKKDSVKKAVAELGDADLHRYVLVGDRRFDAEGAAAAGIDSIGVLFGYGCSDELENSPFTFIAKDIKHLKELL
jgi:phosphoglycolate phosphatase